jgi:deoxycytidylate deaminase
MDEPKHNCQDVRLNVQELISGLFLKLERKFKSEQPKFNKMMPDGVSKYPLIYESKINIDNSIMILCLLWSQMRSKDPNTKVGAAIYDHSTGSIHFGYNGFNKGVPDHVEVWDNRDINKHPNKYDRVVHGECNGIEKALKAGYNPEKSVLFITNWPCRVCVKNHIVPSGIKKMFYLDDYPQDEESKAQLIMAGVKFEKLSLSI